MLRKAKSEQPRIIPNLAHGVNRQRPGTESHGADMDDLQPKADSTRPGGELGCTAGDIGQRVLRADADRQPTLSIYYPIDEFAAGGLARLIVDAPIDRRQSSGTSSGTGIWLSTPRSGA